MKVHVRGRTPLQHSYPRWVVDREEFGDTDPREVWAGKMRIVRSRKRMRKLKRRGVPMMHLGYGSGFDLPGKYAFDRETGRRLPRGPWAWFETEASYEGRKLAKRFLQELSKVRGPIHYNEDSISLLERAAFAALARTTTQVDIEWPTEEDAKTAFATMGLGMIFDIEPATGASLDRLCKIPIRTDEETDAEFLQRVGVDRKLYTELKAQSNRGDHYPDCDCVACQP